jgi:methyl halide transferase
MTDWNERYRQQDMPWEKGTPAPPLVELLERCPSLNWGAGPVLVPGCGYGHDVRLLAQQGLTVVGLDLADIAISQARQFQRIAAESYELGNFLDAAWRENREFSAIWEHTCFCAIDPSDRGRYAQAVAGLLSAGGMLAGVFFLTPYDPGETTAGPPFGTTIEELQGHFSPYFELVESWVPARAYPGREGREWIGIFRKNAVQ